MEKLKLIEIKHGEKRLSFTIRKDKPIKQFLSALLETCGFKEIENPYLQYYDVEKKNVTKFEGIEENYVNKKFDIDIIFTHRNVIVLVRICSLIRKKELGERVINFVMKHCDFKEVKS